MRLPKVLLGVFLFDNEISLLFGVFCVLVVSSSEELDLGLFFSLTGFGALGFLMACETPRLIPYFLLAGADLVKCFLILLCCLGGVLSEILELKFLSKFSTSSLLRMNRGTYDGAPP